ncbi:MAG TPA: CRTAC1 family protein, partial [Planctomycetota bacterium]|nr:CRTAC1 family protein [Planctomycetota bacterium]
VRRVRFDLAVAWMRLGESRNCVARHTAHSCLLPIGPEGVHADREGSERALQLFEQLLREDPDDASSRWLLNLAAMTLGEWPERVAEPWRLPAGTLASQGEIVRLTDVASERGLTGSSLAGGAVADDFDGDGHLDLVTTSMHPAGQMRFFRGDGAGRFQERSEEAGLVGLYGGLNANQADFDGDGDLDLFVMRGAWRRAAGRTPNSLLANDGQGRFRDVTYDAGLADPAWPTQTSAWCDYDLDGDLDLYVGNECEPSIRAPCQLFENRGDGTFVDVAERAGVENLHFAKSVAWGDVDEDGWPDLFVSNQNGPNRLYRNRGDGTFVDVAREAGVLRPLASFPSWFFDADGDGHLDLFVGAYLPALEPVARGRLGLPFRVETDALYLGDGKGGFRDVARAWGFTRPTLPMGANFGDLDQDGWLDIYLGTGYPAYEGLMPNVLWRNDRGRRFLDVTTAAGVGHLQKGHGVAFADFDEDGDTDLFVEMGGAFPGDAFVDALFENPGQGAHFLDVRLVGADRNTHGVGARLCLRAAEPDGSLRARYVHVGSGGSFGANPLRQRIGLAAAERVHSLEVRWPRGHVQVFHDLPADTLVRVHEGRDEPELVARAKR